MTEQDASEEPAGDESDDVSAEAEAEDIDDFAEEPDGDVDERLAEIAAAAVSPEDLPSDVDGLGDLEPPFDPAEIDVDDALIERVEETDPAAIAVELATLQLRVATLEGETVSLREEVEDLETRLARKQADFQNYKKRQQERLEDEKQRATQDLVERLLDVRDNLARALEQDEDADIRGGVESTLRQFDDELDRENVSVVEPEPGEETDPQRHEVLMRVESEEPEGTVADVHRPGYEMAGTVLRAAQVTVSEGPDEDSDDADGNDGTEAREDAEEDDPDDTESK